jgi:hypothetical protein
MVGFVAGLPNFFDAPAVPSALVDFTAGPVTATPAETAPLDTLSEPATALAAKTEFSISREISLK